MTIKTPPEIRFWKKVKKLGPNECWPWIGDRHARGYGRFVPHPKRRDAHGKRPNPVLSHRLALIYSGHEIPEGHEVCHHCDNPPCCNPRHLFTGTHGDNMRDCMKKRRLNTQRGVATGHAKLTDEKVAEIRRRYVPFVVTARSLAKEYGVSHSLILLVAKRRWWKHVA